MVDNDTRSISEHSDDTYLKIYYKNHEVLVTFVFNVVISIM